MRPGDWKCPECDDHQFARNTHCRLCQTAKPKGEGKGGEVYNFNAQAIGGNEEVDESWELGWYDDYGNFMYSLTDSVNAAVILNSVC